jgi:hypothetical protein
MDSLRGDAMTIKERLSTAAALVLVCASLGLAACDEDDGPAEQAGEQLDEAGEAVEDAVKEATD